MAGPVGRPVSADRGPDLEALLGEIERLRPAELIVDEDQAFGDAFDGRIRVTRRPPWHFELDSATRLLCEQFGTRDLSGFGCEPRTGIAAAGALLQYVNDTQKAALPHLQSIRVELSDDAVIMDGPTRRNLELEESLSGHHEHTLAGVMDRCQTAMGSRLLRRWIQRPLRETTVLMARYQALDAMTGSGAVDALQQRCTASAMSNAYWRASPCAPPGRATCASSAKRCRACPELRRQLASIESPLLDDLLHKSATTTAAPPARKRDYRQSADADSRWRRHRPGYDDELDDLRAIAENADQYLVDLEARERERTGIAHLARLQPRARLTTSKSASRRPTRRP